MAKIIDEVETTDDTQQICQLIDQMFVAISCDKNKAANWQDFASRCADGVSMFPSARPINRISIDAFTNMMQRQMDDGSIETFSERTLGHHVQVFGNIAVVMSAYEATVNNGSPSRGVNAFLLVKDETWSIVAMAWDSETNDIKIPDRLLSPDSA